MQYDQVDKGGAAGGGQLLALFVGFRPLGGLGGGSHVASQTHFYYIGKASFLQSSPPTGHSDIGTKLALGSRSDQGNHPLAGFDGIDHFHNVCLGSNSPKGTVMDTFPAANAFTLIDHTDAVLIVGDSIRWACFLARTFQMGDCIIGTRRTDDLHHIGGIQPGGTLPFRQTNALPNNFSFFINTAAILGPWPGNDLVWKIALPSTYPPKPVEPPPA